MGVYGPRTIYCIALKGVPGCHEFLLQDDGKWLHVKETTEIGEGKMFSPGNLRATFDNAAYERLISYYVGEKYTLRYTGGMVPGASFFLLPPCCHQSMRKVKMGATRRAGHSGLFKDT